MEIMRRKVKLRQPYVGVFLKKDANNSKDVVDNLSDIYPVGTFCQIQEYENTGDKMRMIVIAHRRIRITNQLYEEVMEPPAPKKQIKLEILNQKVTVTADDDEPEAAKKRSKKRSRSGGDKQIGKSDRIEPRVLAEGEQQPVLVVEVENVKKEQLPQTDEVKALTQEMIKTLRELITMNQLYRDNLQHLLHQNQRIVNDPIYLCDLGASLSAAEQSDLQEILHEEDVSRI